MKKVDIARQLRLIDSYGIHTWVNYMLAAPDSTLQDDLDSIALNRRSKVTYAAYSTTVPMKGTALYDYSVARGLIDPQTHVGDLSGCCGISTLACFTVQHAVVDHFFPYRIAEYKRHEYRKVWYFQPLPHSVFRRLEKRLGWHLCVEAVTMLEPVPSVGVHRVSLHGRGEPTGSRRRDCDYERCL
jgi:radical SAM superfamily enzyme YgiQ (UPF0313 family)